MCPAGGPGKASDPGPPDFIAVAFTSNIHNEIKTVCDDILAAVARMPHTAKHKSNSTGLCITK